MSWTDICSNCDSHRADCECGDWNGYEKNKKLSKKKLKRDNKELIEYAIEYLILCADYSKTLTSGNVSHVGPALEGRLRRTAEYLEKHYKEIENEYEY